MSYGNDFACIGDDGVGIEVPLDVLVRLRADLPAQLLSGAVIEINNSTPAMIVRLVSKVEQTLYDIGWNAALLKPHLSMTGHGQHFPDSFNDNNAVDVKKIEAHLMRLPEIPTVGQ